MRVFHLFFRLLTGALLAGALALPLHAEETWLLFEESVHLKGTVDGDVFLLANEILLPGETSEDVWAFGRSIQIDGTVGDDARLFGLEVVTLDGIVEDDARIMSSVGNVVISEQGMIRGDAILQAGKRITLNGTIEGNVWAEAPRIVIEGEVKGDLTVNSPKLQILPGTIIHGDLIDRGSKPAAVPDGVQVLGERRREGTEPTELSRQVQQLAWILKGLQFITAYVIGLMMLRMFPRFTGQNIDLLMYRQGPLVSVGLITFLTATLAGYFLLFSILGTGVGLFLLLINGLLFYLGKLMVAFLLGMWALRQTRDLGFGGLALALLIGLLLLYTASSIPYIGGSIYILTSCWGMGAILVTLRLSQKPLRLHTPQNPTPNQP